MHIPQQSLGYADDIETLMHESTSDEMALLSNLAYTASSLGGTENSIDRDSRSVKRFDSGTLARGARLPVVVYSYRIRARQLLF